MTLNVKDPEAHRLATAIAEFTGETITRVVLEALRARYAEIQKREGRASLEELTAMAERISQHCREPYVDHAALLYDEHGLPR